MYSVWSANGKYRIPNIKYKWLGELSLDLFLLTDYTFSGNLKRFAWRHAKEMLRNKTRALHILEEHTLNNGVMYEFHVFS